MDFKAVTEKLLAEFERQQISYALIGGFAVSLWGFPRSTVDLDFLIRNIDMAKARRILESLGYECRYASENVTQFHSTNSRLGEVDFIHAFRPASLAMLERSERKSIFDGERTISVIQPEDLIGLKVQALANNPSRRSVDMTDIKGLMKVLGNRLDWRRIENYFSLFDMQADFAELRKLYDVEFER